LLDQTEWQRVMAMLDPSVVANSALDEPGE